MLSCRDIMRKDKGLSGDLDRLPMLVWVMFLKFIDDMERIREEEAVLKGEKFRQTIVAPYRWRDWAAGTHLTSRSSSSVRSRSPIVRTGHA
jgi:type I restriction enzyme M protein